jgi:thioesterase domain-containing protein
MNGDGALNDLSADAMLALFPGLETQYKKAVWDALESSGALASDAPIMLTGWSLGGMMAGDLATDPRLSGRCSRS